LSAERLQALAMARQKAAEVRRQKAAQKAEARELQRLEREVERKSLVKRRQELEAKLSTPAPVSLAQTTISLAQTAPATLAPTAPLAHPLGDSAIGRHPLATIPEAAPEAVPKPKKKKKGMSAGGRIPQAPPPPPPSSESSDDEEGSPQAVTQTAVSLAQTAYRARVQQMREDLVYKQLFG
jgi:hypothetical protein